MPATVVTTRRARAVSGLVLAATCLLLSWIADLRPGHARWLVELADVARVGCWVGSSLLIGAVLAICWRQRHDLSTYQAARFAGLPFVALGVLGTEVEHFHDEVTYRLPLFVAFLALELYGVGGLRRGRDRLPERRIP